MRTPKRKSANQSKRTHIPALTPEQLELAIQQLKAETAIPVAGQQLIEDMLRAASAPGGESIGAAISGLPPERRQIVQENTTELSVVFGGLVTRGNQRLMAMSEDEWQALLDESE